MTRAPVRTRALYLVVLLGVAAATANVGFAGVAAAGNAAPVCSDVNYAGDGSEANPYQIGSAAQLQCLGENHGDAVDRADALGSHYEVVSDIDASGTANWNGGSGFDPIGDSANQFTGTFDGNEYAISELTIDRPSENDVGVFSYIGSSGTVANVALEDIDVHGNGAYPDGVGGLAGQSDGSLMNVSTNGTVVGDKYRVGGVVGIVGSSGSVTNASSSATVSGSGIMGGLVSENDGVVTRSYATGSVSGMDSGGLVGYNSGTVTRSYATGSVSGDYAGGLVSRNRGTVTRSYATGSVSGPESGGLVGYNLDTVTRSYATGSVSGMDSGGLVGYNLDTVTSSYWDTETSGQSSSDAGTGLTTAEMTGADAAENMDLGFDSTWAMTESYPELQWALPSANLDYSEPVVSPTTLTPGGAVEAEVTVSNTGEADAEYAVSFAVDGTVVAREYGIVPGGRSTTITTTERLWDVGDHTVSVSGGDASVTETVTVEDRTAPTADAGADQTVDQGAATTFDASASSDNVGIDEYEWDFGDGNTATGRTPTHTYDDPGTYTVTLTATDAAGNADSDTLTVTVEDTVPPAAPSAPALAPASDSGESSTDGVTNETTPTITGTAEANAVVEVRSDLDGTLGTTTADGDGDWSFTPGTALSEGAHTVTARATDAAGNTGSFSPGLTVVVDTTPPATPSVPGLAAASDTGESSTDGVTNETTPTITGTAGPGEAVTVISSIDGTLGTTTADGSGDWSLTPGTALSQGAHGIVARAADSAGNTAESSPTLVVVDSTAPPPPVLALTDASDTGASNTDGVTNETTPTLSGTARAGATVEIASDRDGSLGTATVDGSGDWSFTPGAALSEGTHGLTATITDAAGNTRRSSPLSVTVDTTAPTGDAGGDRTVAVGDAVTFDANESSDNVGIAAYEWTFGEEENATGENVTHAFAEPGRYSVDVTVTDTSGNRDTDTIVVTVTDRTVPTALVGNDTTVRVGDSVAFDATNSTDDVGVASYEWGFDDGANATGATAAHTYDAAGTYAVALTVTDAAGNSDSAVRNVTVRSSPQPSNPTPSNDGGSGGGTTATDADPEPTVVVDRSAETGSGRATVSVSDPGPGEPVVIEFDDDEIGGSPGTFGRNVSVSRLTMNVTTEADFSLDVATYERAEAPTDEASFHRDTGATPAGYVVVNHSVSDADIENVTFRFRLGKAAVESAGLDADAVALYRDEGTQWRELDAALVDETDREYVFEATSPGLSLFVVGSTVPAFDVTATDRSARTATVGDTATVTASVENTGGVSGTYTADLLANGERVASENLSVGAFGDSTVTFAHRFDRPGTYELALENEVLSTVTVDSTEPEPSPTATPSDAGSPPPATVEETATGDRSSGRSTATAPQPTAESASPVVTVSAESARKDGGFDVRFLAVVGAPFVLAGFVLYRRFDGSGP
ncbi:Ig-like domain-containing protein [Halosimplex sp. TS25]|uniref:Ig-like domain-containing protein n=1 Tax=Halosimplex rarum TaxID=3396619 RepID=UPI0039ED65C4